MAGSPYDFNRDGRWSTPERAFTHYGIGEELRRANGEGAGRGGGSTAVDLPQLTLGVYLVRCGGCVEQIVKR